MVIAGSKSMLRGCGVYCCCVCSNSSIARVRAAVDDQLLVPLLLRWGRGWGRGGGDGAALTHRGSRCMVGGGRCIV